MPFLLSASTNAVPTCAPTTCPLKSSIDVAARVVRLHDQAFAERIDRVREVDDLLARRRFQHRGRDDVDFLRGERRDQRREHGLLHVDAKPGRLPGRGDRIDHHPLDRIALDVENVNGTPVAVAPTLSVAGRTGAGRCRGESDAGGETGGQCAEPLDERNHDVSFSNTSVRRPVADRHCDDDPILKRIKNIAKRFLSIDMRYDMMQYRIDSAPCSWKRRPISQTTCCSTSRWRKG